MVGEFPYTDFWEYVLRMRNRKLRNILPSGGLLTGSDKVTWPEEALSGSGPDRK